MDSLFMSFVPGDSIIHRLDPRTKILGLMLASICIFYASSFEWIALIALVFVILILVCKLPLKHFVHSARPMILFFVILFLMQLLFTEGKPIFSSKWITISYEGLVLGTILTLRFIFLLLFAALLTTTTSPSKITAGIEKFLRPLPLKYMGISSHDLAMMMSMSIYFVPMMYDNFRNLKDAQLSRGLNIKKDPVKAIIALSVPLVSISVRAAEDVALAIESRCYKSTGRTSVHMMGLKKNDYICLFLYILLILFCIAY
ncbi:energy-coupling factor transporter transmembrane component T family protein [Methanolobus psychrotolerans]|uniref:energy-coupling factor transporter transmembrane component T family protein n=1 Tax=Methanolobus psychrotolerans TaxID=1874706 RepID=UPI000B916342|nr:energy-coupling factor transporter transmembrane protein EcfT [Methanolobus psychrotolerans]